MQGAMSGAIKLKVVGLRNEQATGQSAKETEHHWTNEQLRHELYCTSLIESPACNRGGREMGEIS